MRRLGAHLSMAGGLVQAAQNMMDMGGNCLQIFSGSPRSWARKPLTEVNAEPFKRFCKEHDFGPIFTHALYLVNLASDQPALLENSTKSLIYDLQFDARICGGGVVVHLGSHLGKGFEAVRDALVKKIKTILDATPADSTFIIENSAGQQGKIASNLQEIRVLFDALQPYVSQKRLRWCFDTCHAYANGYSLLDVEKEIRSHALLDTLAVIHLNDSRDPFESGRDRHENIGEGNIGREVLKSFLHVPAFEKIPLILEVPGFDGKGPDAKNIEIVKVLLVEK